MQPFTRKLALTFHVLLSVGWLGAVVAYLALAITGLTASDGRMAGAAYLSLEVIGWFVIVPFSLATLVAGLVEVLGTYWGLFRHWWIFLKFLLTLGATIVLLQHMPAVSRMSQEAAAMALSTSDFHDLRIQLIVHAAGGLFVLLAATVVSAFKPSGMTPYGRRKQQEELKLSAVAAPTRSEPAGVAALRSTGNAPRWVRVVGIHVIVLAALSLVLHLLGGDLRHS